MKYRKLGKTGLSVSEIGFGCWGIGGLSKGATSYGPMDDAVSKKALRTACDLGITFFDTSNLYGYGHSETLLGDVFALCRNKILLASKVGFIEHKGPQDFSPEYLRESLEGSLKRLRTDYLDLYQLHSPDIGEVEKKPEIMLCLQSLKKEGKIRAFGISVRSPDDGLKAIQLGFPCIQVNLNMVDQRAGENGLLTSAAEKHIGIIARTPLCFGFLTGRLHGLTFHRRDHRSSWSKDQLQRWSRAPDLFSFINKGKKRTPAQLALKFCLNFPAVASAIPGMETAEQVTENVKTAEQEALSKTALSEIRLVYQSHVFFDRTS